jgi:tetratricopeptide (TPR) repeat protein
MNHLEATQQARNIFRSRRPFQFSLLLATGLALALTCSLGAVSGELDAAPATAWQFELVDSAGDVGLNRSLGIDALGRPHIVYSDNFNFDGERRLYHADIAQALEQLYAGRLTDITAQLAHHYQEAGEAEKAIPYLIQLGDRSRSVSAFAEAAAAYERAVELSSEGAADDDLLAGLLVKLGNVRENLGEYESARARLAEGLKRARRCGARPAETGALNGLGWVAVKQGAYDEARRLCEEALERAEAAGDRASAALALRRLGVIARRLGDTPAAISRYQASLALYRELGDCEGEIGGLNNLANAETSAGDFAAATRHYSEVLAAAQESGNRFMVAVALGNLGEAARRRGDLPAAQDSLQQAITLCGEIGDRGLGALFTRNLAEAMAESADYVAADRLYRSVLRETLAAGALPMALSALVGIADVQARSGYHTQAAEWVGLALGQPACDRTVVEEAEAVLNRLRPLMPPDQLEVALAHGREQTWEALAGL